MISTESFIQEVDGRFCVAWEEGGVFYAPAAYRKTTCFAGCYRDAAVTGYSYKRLADARWRVRQLIKEGRIEGFPLPAGGPDVG